MNEKHCVSLEKWKPVKGYEDLYEVSNYGRIKSLKRPGNYKERFLVPFWAGRKNREYFVVELFKNNKGKSFKVHRLVASAFLYHSDEKNIVHHKDFNRYNNKVDNLEWVNQSQNTNYDYKQGVRSFKGEKNTKAVLTEKEVKLLRYLKNLYPQIKIGDIAKYYDITKSSVSAIFTRKNWRYL